MTTEQCSKEGCGKPGLSKCSGCRNIRYCSRECQKSDWRNHKQSCASIISANCFIIRALPQSAPQSPLDNIAAQLEPFPLSDVGNEVAEKRQLASRLQYTRGRTVEVGKFYDHQGTHQWYYYVYGAGDAFTNTQLPRNEVGGLICYRPVYGDIAVVRSGPSDAQYNAEIKLPHLKAAIEFHKTHDRSEVFGQREMSRMTERMELDLTGGQGLFVTGTSHGTSVTPF